MTVRDGSPPGPVTTRDAQPLEGTSRRGRATPLAQLALWRDAPRGEARPDRGRPHDATTDGTPDAVRGA